MHSYVHTNTYKQVLGAGELLYEDWNTDLNNKIDKLLDESLIGSNMRLHLTCPDQEMPSSFLEGDPSPAQQQAAENAGRVRAQNEEEDEVADVPEEECIVLQKDLEKELLDPAAVGTCVHTVSVGTGEGEADGWEVDEWYGTRYKVADIPQRIVKNAGDWFSHLTDPDKCLRNERLGALGTFSLPFFLTISVLLDHFALTYLWLLFSLGGSFRIDTRKPIHTRTSIDTRSQVGTRTCITRALTHILTRAHTRTYTYA